MAVPDSLTSWREFVDRQPVEPLRMTMKQISGLSPDEKAAYDQERFAWLAADVVLETHDTVALTRQTRIIMARDMAKTATARRGLAMSGSSGLVCDCYLRAWAGRTEAWASAHLWTRVPSPAARHPRLPYLCRRRTRRRCRRWRRPRGRSTAPVATRTHRRHRRCGRDQGCDRRSPVSPRRPR
jgi:hypothetical protein